jgi:hypothetical protein
LIRYALRIGTIPATSRLDSPNDMRQTISKWVRNPDRSPYGKDPPTGKTPIPPNFVSRSCSEAYIRNPNFPSALKAVSRSTASSGTIP